MRWRIIGFAGAGLVLVVLAIGPVGAEDAAWDALRGGGQVVLIRHASTVAGLGDPSGFRLDDCATQRNLSEAGRAEARRIGAAFRRHGIPVDRVLSSRWCRCLETAWLAFGRVEPWPALDSFFDDRAREPDRTRAVLALIAESHAGGNLVLVTHQVNITSLTGIVPATGEVILLTPQAGGTVRIAGRLRPAELPGH
jgi:broad specificity phosphatase PhoE